MTDPTESRIPAALLLLHQMFRDPEYNSFLETAILIRETNRNDRSLSSERGRFGMDSI